MTNLLNNAAKYTQQGGQITVGVEVTEGQVKISVSDNGIGIESSLIPYLFELFTQAHRTPDRSQGGLGLGLALVKSIIELHGGSVSAQSDGPGKGSVFALTLPASKRAQPEQTLWVDHDDVTESPRLRVQIVDDNLDAAETLAAVLESSGHSVTVAESGTKALEVAKSFNPEVFILDIGLPDMDGFELARQLRKDPTFSQSTLIALTGYGRASDHALSKRAGFNRHLVKPIDPDSLLDMLDALNPRARMEEG